MRGYAAEIESDFSQFSKINIVELLCELDLAVLIKGNNECPDACRISVKGINIFKRGGWKEYLEREKIKQNDIDEKFRYDKQISWFRSKTGWLPYLLSIISIGIALWSLSVSKNTVNKVHSQSNNTLIQKQEKHKGSSTKNIPNEKAVGKDTFHLRDSTSVSD